MRLLLLSCLGPLAVRELLELARRPPTYLIRSVMGLVLLGTLWAVYLHSANEGRDPIRTAAQIGHSLFSAILYLQYMLVVAIVPLFVANVVAGERERGSLDLLLMTPLSGRHIVFGLFLGRLTLLLAWTLVPFGILSLTAASYGGVDFESLFLAELTTVASVVVLAALTMRVSCTSRSTVRAILISYFIGVIIFLLIPLLAEASFGPRSAEFEYVQLLSPKSLFLLALDADKRAYLALVGLDWLFWYYLMGWMVFSVGLLLVSSVLLRDWHPKPLAHRGIRKAWFAWLNQVTRRGSAENTRETGDSWDRNNLLWVRAKRGHAWDRESILYRVQWLTIISYLVVVFCQCATAKYFNLRYAASNIVYLFLVFRIFVVLAISVSLPIDRRRGFLDQLLMTPISSKEIVDGVLLGSMEHLRLLVAGIFAMLLLHAVQLDAAESLLHLCFCLLHVLCTASVSVLLACRTRSMAETLLGGLIFVGVTAYLGIGLPRYLLPLVGSEPIHRFWALLVPAFAMTCTGLMLMRFPRLPAAGFVAATLLLWFGSIGLVTALSLSGLLHREQDYTLVALERDLCFNPLELELGVLSGWYVRSSLSASHLNPDLAYTLAMRVMAIAVAAGFALYIRAYTIRNFDLWMDRQLQKEEARSGMRLPSRASPKGVNHNNLQTKPL